MHYSEWSKAVALKSYAYKTHLEEWFKFKHWISLLECQMQYIWSGAQKFELVQPQAMPILLVWDLHSENH